MSRDYVYVVIEDTGNEHEVDGWLLVGVYSTEEKALAAAATAENPKWASVMSAEIDR